MLLTYPSKLPGLSNIPLHSSKLMIQLPAQTRTHELITVQAFCGMLSQPLDTHWVHLCSEWPINPESDNERTSRNCSKYVPTGSYSFANWQPESLQFTFISTQTQVLEPWSVCRTSVIENRFIPEKLDWKTACSQTRLALHADENYSSDQDFPNLTFMHLARSDGRRTCWGGGMGRHRLNAF